MSVAGRSRGAGSDFNGVNPAVRRNAIGERRGGPILSVNNTYGSSWRTPTQILAGRLLKFGFQMTF